MPQEIAGFYYDPEKNRYFPSKDPLTKASRKPPQIPISSPTMVRSSLKKGLSKLLHGRELHGSLINVSGRKRNFEEEYKQTLVSKRKVWRYQDIEQDATGSLSMVNINVETSEGQYTTDALLTGGGNGSLSLFDVGYVGNHLSHSLTTTADFIWPESSNADCCGMSKDIWKLGGVTFVMPSAISGISVPRKGPLQEDTDDTTLKGNIQPSCTVYMPSSVCCLESLQTYDQYFLASSMDGSIRLYDHRLTSRGPVQSYEGHVNSYSHIKLATDSSESFVMSGGEDCEMRIWSIKSGELLFEEKLSDSIPLTCCWQRSGGLSEAIDETQVLEDFPSTQTRKWDAWVGTFEGLLQMQFPE